MAATKFRRNWNIYSSQQTERQCAMLSKELTTKFITQRSQHIPNENAK